MTEGAGAGAGAKRRKDTRLVTSVVLTLFGLSALTSDSCVHVQWSDRSSHFYNFRMQCKGTASHTQRQTGEEGEDGGSSFSSRVLCGVLPSFCSLVFVFEAVAFFFFSSSLRRARKRKHKRQTTTKATHTKHQTPSTERETKRASSLSLLPSLLHLSFRYKTFICPPTSQPRRKPQTESEAQHSQFLH